MLIWELNVNPPMFGLKPCHSLSFPWEEPGLSEFAVEAWERQTEGGVTIEGLHNPFTLRVKLGLTFDSD